MRHIAAAGAAAGVVLLSLTACGPATSGGASASCVGPLLDAQPPGTRDDAKAPSVHAGAELTIYGHWFTDTCNDTGQIGALDPLGPVRLTLGLPGGTSVPLGTFTPGGKELGFAAHATVPKDTPRGSATVTDQDGHTYRFTVATP